jgi:FtsH-binding integral membrane protein
MRWVKAGLLAAAVLAVVAAVAACWQHPALLLGRDGFWLVEVAGLVVVVAIARLVQRVIRQDQEANEETKR